MGGVLLNKQGQMRIKGSGAVRPPAVCRDGQRRPGFAIMIDKKGGGPKDELRRLIEHTDDRWVEDVVDYVRWWQQDAGTRRMATRETWRAGTCTG